MLNFIKKNKILSILLLLSFISIILGIFFNTVIGSDNREIVNNNINNLFNINSVSKTILFNHLISSIIVWFIGISLIGFIFILIIYLFNLFIFSFEGSSLIINLGLKNIITIIVYLVPKLFYLVTLFILSLYSISYSLCLFRIIFKGKNYNMVKITKKYITICVICLVIIIISNTLELFILPRLNIIKY